jgi:hypothetical protein
MRTTGDYLRKSSQHAAVFLSLAVVSANRWSSCSSVPTPRDFAAGQADLTTAFSDLSSGQLAAGLAAFFAGVDDDALSAPNNLLIGTVSAATNEPEFLSVVPLEELLLGAAASF